MTKFKPGDRVIVHGVVEEYETDEEEGTSWYCVSFAGAPDWEPGTDFFEEQLELDTSPIPEPPFGTVVQAGPTVFQRYTAASTYSWHLIGDDSAFTWSEVRARGPITILREGPAK